MSNSELSLLVIVGVTLTLLIVGTILAVKLKKLAITILCLIGWFVISSLFERFFFDYFIMGRLFGSFVSFIRITIAVAVGILLSFRFFSSHIFSRLNAENVPDYSAPHVLRDSVAKILDSENFITALRSTLPKGEDDQRFGFDYIPFMLHAIDERRKRAVKSARFFLLATTFSALLFSGVVMYFGYILVNEASAGTAKSLTDIRGSLESTSEALRVLIPSYYDNPEFQQVVAPSLDRLERLEPGEKNQELRDKIVAVINEAKRTSNFVPLSTALPAAENAVSKGNEKERVYSAALTEATSNIVKFKSAQSIAVPELSSRIEELKLLIPKAEDTLNKPENRVPEIIKRLALGLVIATFFLALLRYMGGLYRTRYQQVLAAEGDDFMVRRFYVAFKSSIQSDEQRKTILSNFMTGLNSTNGIDSREPSGNATKQEYEILKELLAALSKKL